MPTWTERTVTTRKGLTIPVRSAGEGEPIVFLHGLVGLAEDEPFLDALAERHAVSAPTWPGFGEREGEDAIEDMLDFALHGLDVIDALGLGRVRLVGHSFGGMVAAEMACLQADRFERVGLVAPFGLWVDDAPIADAFATMAFDLPGLLFADAEAGQRALASGLDFSDDGALTRFMVDNARRMGTAGKVLFPVPNRRLSKRLYRLESETLVAWGAEDALIPPLYAAHWEKALARGRRVEIAGAGHMVTLEAAAPLAEAMLDFLA